MEADSGRTASNRGRRPGSTRIQDTRSRSPLARARLTRLGWRLLGAAIVLLAVVTITFFAVRAVPGDPVLAVLGGPGSNATPEAVAQARADYGLDRPLWMQYFMTLGHLASGDLGMSYAQKRPVAAILGELLPGTTALAFAALIVGWCVALVLAWVSFLPGRIPAVIAEIVGVVASALPHFWIGAVLIAIFAIGLRLPVAISSASPWGIVLPAATLALPLGGYLAQVMRDRMLDTLGSPFIVAARARGESEASVFWRHALRHSVLPAVNLSGWAFGSLVSGAVVVETLFARPGLGRGLVDAVTARDVPLIVGVIVVVALAYVVVTVITEAIEVLLDPRLAVSP